MTDEPEQPEPDAQGVEYIDPCLSLGDGECWIADADLLLPSDDDGEGDDQIVAIQFTVERGLWYMTRKERWWHNPEQQQRKKGALRPIKSDKP